MKILRSVQSVPVLALSVALLFPFSLAQAAAPSAEPATMKAVIAADNHLSVQSVPVPEPGPDQVLVRVKAASVNPVDWKLAARAEPGAKSTPGRDFAGAIEKLGPGVTGWKVGDEVIGVSIGGAYAQYSLASVKAIARKPHNLSYVEASGIPVVGETAWRAIVTVADVQPGQHVFIQGGAGGVGSAAVQIAKARGAEVVTTARSSNAAYLRSIGASEVIDYTTTKFEDRVKGVDAALNTVDADTGARTIGVVKKGGILVSVVGAPPADQCQAAGIRCAVTGSVTGEMLPRLTELAEAGKFHLSVEERLPLDKAETAWEQSRTGHVRGKIVLVP